MFGQKPTFATITSEENRRVHCHDCLIGWNYHRISCPVCGTKNHEHFLKLHPEGASGKLFVELCINCGSYLKAKKKLNNGSGFNPVLEDAETMHLNYLVHRSD